MSKYKGFSKRELIEVYTRMFMSRTLDNKQLILLKQGKGFFHIGASGVLYGLVSFMFFSGVFSKNTQLLAFALLITFLYGSMVWGIFPETVKEGVSWEAHLSGSIIGFILSIIFPSKSPVSVLKPNFISAMYTFFSFAK